ncbi:Phage-related protein, tail component [Pasteurella testudinis DSM 23072]|uniref:Phage-related protein, tail component n=1 Tax=Pasteurella testudinis DSM 23072 TaxID=1122938 RepID=A0A1W1V1Y9_9PAST|nr:tail assembly protein [Pasteurella testudinis]SMB87335.1 Phage-related protein, tail component [Pasteurella testudinis DSM 23072]SUB51645.1 Phage-related protein, tail component [Pasteurella testudinis]
MATVRFYGDLQRFGTEFKLNVDTAQEALQGLYVQVKGLKAKINKGYYRIKIAGKEYGMNDIRIGLTTRLKTNSVINLIPVIAGASAAFRFVAGAILAVVGAIMVNPYMIAIGAALAIGGAVELLTKPPGMNIKTDDAEKKTNTSFSSIKNLTPQGRPVPLLYGEIMHSIVLISQGLEVFTPED